MEPVGSRGVAARVSPNRRLEPGEHVVLGEIEGPATVRHIWMTFPPAPPEVMRALAFEVFYDGAAEPSISLPALDFFSMPLGRPVDYASVLTAAQEGRGFNAFFPMPIRGSARFELTNLSQRVVSFYYQTDYTMEPDLDPGDGYLHVSWRRENPTTMLEDFTIVDGIAGPGRFLGCSIGVRVLDQGDWYGEGEVKVFRDGGDAFPTICGTGLEDYVGTAWTMGAHAAPYAGSPLEVRGPDTGRQPDLLSFYRWHVLDPIMFESELRITIQQIGAVRFAVGDEARFEA